jgi:hypothetical protein
MLALHWPQGFKPTRVTVICCNSCHRACMHPMSMTSGVHSHEVLLAEIFRGVYVPHPIPWSPNNCMHSPVRSKHPCALAAPQAPPS